MVSFSPSATSNFASFLDLVNAHRPRQSDQQERPFDRETAAKQMLEALRAGPVPAARLAADLGLTPDQFQVVRAYLEDADMVRPLPPGVDASLELTDFAAEALKVFTLR